MKRIFALMVIACSLMGFAGCAETGLLLATDAIFGTPVILAGRNVVKNTPRYFQYSDTIEFKKAEPDILKVAEEVGRSLGYTIQKPSPQIIRLTSGDIGEATWTSGVTLGIATPKPVIDMTITMMDEKRMDMSLMMWASPKSGNSEEKAKAILGDLKSRILAKAQET